LRNFATGVRERCRVENAKKKSKLCDAKGHIIYSRMPSGARQRKKNDQGKERNSR